MWAGLSSGFPFLTRCFWNVLLVLLSLDESHLSGRSTSFVLRPFSIHPLFSFQRPCCFLAVRRLARHLLSYHFSCSTVKGQFLAFLAFLPLVKIKCSGPLICTPGRQAPTEQHNIKFSTGSYLCQAMFKHFITFF